MTMIKLIGIVFRLWYHRLGYNNCSQTITWNGYQDIYCAWMDTSGEISSIRYFEVTHHLFNPILYRM